MPNDLTNATENAVEQLLRYGGAVWTPEILDLLESLTDLNDDYANGRDKECVMTSIVAMRNTLASMEERL